MGNLQTWMIFFAGLLIVGVLAVIVLAALLKAIARQMAFSSDKLPTTDSGKAGLAVSEQSLRKSDNRLQALLVLLTVLLSTAAGTVMSSMNKNWKISPSTGALIGSLVGLLIGLIASGILIMVIRKRRKPVRNS